MALEASGPLQKQLDNNLMIESLLGGDKNRDNTVFKATVTLHTLGQHYTVKTAQKVIFTCKRALFRIKCWPC